MESVDSSWACPSSIPSASKLWIRLGFVYTCVFHPNHASSRWVYATDYALNSACRVVCCGGRLPTHQGGKQQLLQICAVSTNGRWIVAPSKSTHRCQDFPGQRQRRSLPPRWCGGRIPLSGHGSNPVCCLFPTIFLFVRGGEHSRCPAGFG